MSRNYLRNQNTHDSTDLSQKPRALRLLSLREVFDESLEPPKWVLEGWIPWGKVGLLGAVSDQGKTWLAMGLGVALATGQPFLGISTKPYGCGVLYITFEDDEPQDIQRRIQALKATYGEHWTEREEVDLRRNLQFLTPTWNPGSSTALWDLQAEVRDAVEAMQAQGITPALVVVDTLSHVNGEGESNVVEAQRVWQAAMGIAKHHNVTVLLVHHLRKAGTNGSEEVRLEDRLHPALLRGSNAAEGAARFIWQMAWVRTDEAERIGMDPELARQRGITVMGMSKLKARKPSRMLLVRSIESQTSGTWSIPPEAERLLEDLLRVSSSPLKPSMEVQVLEALMAGQSRKDIEATLFDGNNKRTSDALGRCRRKGWIGEDGKPTPKGERVAKGRA
ncbi:hypothetical protein GETHOR_23540 [Geothrix oryzae]|uniref:AAA family ATPase n=1 Tax=Geothrix oryzae TaxID=2927975 RepID=A0ABN6V1J9_9BACT|nr:AAA family ATPase [Geothrix oryzae]BDU70253.1 hypothetical protein GETHOR_23540 [Geothrix oryzae]